MSARRLVGRAATVPGDGGQEPPEGEFGAEGESPMHVMYADAALTAGPVAAAAGLALAVHVPVAGRSLRDRLRGAPPAPAVGLRVTAGAVAELPAGELLALTRDSPVPVAAASLHVTGPGPHAVGGEFAHGYRAAAASLGVRDGGWGALLAVIDGEPGPPDGAVRARLTAHLLHRVRCLGLRARPLDPEELADAAGTPADAAVARATRMPHLRRPLVRLPGPPRWRVPEVPEQVLGTGERGVPVTLRAAAVERLTVVAEPEQLGTVLGPALVLGARMGVATARPRRFRDLLDRGAVVLGPGAAGCVDVVVRDGDHPASGDGGGPGIAVRSTIPRPCPARTGPVLVAGAHTWELDDGAGRRAVIRPLPLPPC
ncbi:hypothetical protein [Corynebacterium sp.]|uniref:hypothetical protein n=1 Tax=Corynebacterium sp. TaxID=1720 RepID=UPI0026DD6CB1|nr:hypothetical protein [Corynebacterium sp.]MDO4610009.1 hypothetical protein [Corynebacterium sp.]